MHFEQLKKRYLFLFLIYKPFLIGMNELPKQITLESCEKTDPLSIIISCDTARVSGLVMDLAPLHSKVKLTRISKKMLPHMLGYMKKIAHTKEKNLYPRIREIKDCIEKNLQCQEHSETAFSLISKIDYLDKTLRSAEYLGLPVVLKAAAWLMIESCNVNFVIESFKGLHAYSELQRYKYLCAEKGKEGKRKGEGISILDFQEFNTLPEPSTILRLYDLNLGDVSELDKVYNSTQLERLTKLDLEDNRLISFPEEFFNRFPSLTKLSLARNRLKKLPENIFLKLTKLTSLNVSNNQIQSLPSTIFSSLKALQTLKLHNNQLSSLHPDLFHGLTNLIKLNIGQNKLTKLPPPIFSSLINLKKLYLQKNELRQFSIGLFAHMLKLKTLVVFSNPITPAINRFSELIKESKDWDSDALSDDDSSDSSEERPDSSSDEYETDGSSSE